MLVVHTIGTVGIPIAPVRVAASNVLFSRLEPDKLEMSCRPSIIEPGTSIPASKIMFYKFKKIKQLYQYPHHEEQRV